ncbi:MAG: dihydropteroate synthase [Bacillota bacterium]|nr:dihydropteroate synthase [Bacillota bacterium]
MRFQIRPVPVRDTEEAYREIEAVGADEKGCLIMAPKAVYRVIRIRGLSPKQAQVIKQEMLARGGEAAVARGVIDWSVETTDVLLMGTLGQLASLVRKLKQQPFGLPALADELNRVLYHLEVRPALKLDCRGRRLTIGERTLVMGILNATPDSFSDGGRYLDPEAALERARAMVSQGADIIDLGGESTRPGHEPVGLEEELARVVPVLKRLAGEVKVPISIDTRKPEVAARALEIGAHIVNDQSALEDPRMAETAAAAGAPVILMHYKDVRESPDMMGDIVSFLDGRIARAEAAGLPREKVIVDPGLGFGKTPAQNLEVLRNLAALRGLGQPILIGPSRKSVIGKVLDLPVDERVEGTAAAVAVGIANGADIVRVHDVKEMGRVARMADAIARGWDEENG